MTLKSFKKRAICTVLPYMPIFVTKFLTRDYIVGLCYHVVSGNSLPHVKHLYGHSTPQEFENHVLFLKENFNLISYEEIVSSVYNGIELPINSVFISFDDGMIECYTVVRRILLEHQIPCIFFISTNFMNNSELFYRHKTSLCIEKLSRACDAGDDSGYIRLFSEFSRLSGVRIESLNSIKTWLRALSWSDLKLIDNSCSLLGIDSVEYLKNNPLYLTSDQILTLKRDGFTIGAHGRSHCRLGQELGEEQLKKEIVSSSRIIANLVGETKVPFAFPFSGRLLERSFVTEVKRENKVIELFFDTQKGQLDEKYVINRTMVDGLHPFNALTATIKRRCLVN